MCLFEKNICLWKNVDSIFHFVVKNWLQLDTYISMHKKSVESCFSSNKECTVCFYSSQKYREEAQTLLFQHSVPYLLLFSGYFFKKGELRIWHFSGWTSNHNTSCVYEAKKGMVKGCSVQLPLAVCCINIKA